MPTEPTPLTESEVDAMLADHAATTQGKWAAVETEEPNDPTDPDSEWGWTVHGPRLLELGDYTYHCESDAKWIASAHNQMPALVADWRRLKRIETAAREFAQALDQLLDAYAQMRFDRMRRAVEAQDGV